MLNIFWTSILLLDPRQTMELLARTHYYARQYFIWYLTIHRGYFSFSINKIYNLMGLFYLTHHSKSASTSLNLLCASFSCHVLTDMNKLKLQYFEFHVMNMYFHIAHVKCCSIHSRFETVIYIKNTDLRNVYDFQDILGICKTLWIKWLWAMIHILQL